MTLEAISDLVDYITQEKKPNRADLYERLYYSLIMLKTFLNSDGHGIPYDELEDDTYRVSGVSSLIQQQPIINNRCLGLPYSLLGNLYVSQCL